MSRSTKRRADGDPRRPTHSPAPTPDRAASEKIEVNPPARHLWFLISGVIAVLAWIVFLAVLAIQAR